MERKKLAFIVCIALIVIAQIARADIGSSICTEFLSGPGLNQNLAGSETSAGIFSDLIMISFMIAIIVLSIMGIVYAVAIGFGLEKLKTFVRTEFLEQFFNLILIAVIASGLAFAGAGISFISQIGFAGATSSSNFKTLTIPSLTNINSVYNDLCTKYVDNAIQVLIGIGFTVNTNNILSGPTVQTHGLLNLLPNQFVLSAIMSVEIDAMPDGLGFSITPFAGLWPMQQILSTEMGVYGALAGVMVAVALLLFVIYFLFPLLLYLGVLLRSFPWTRAAGGTLVALFIAFYIIFPAMLEPFSSIFPSNTPTTFTFIVGTQQPQLNTGALSSAGQSSSATTVLSAFAFGNFLGAGMMLQIEGFMQDIAFSVLQIIGVIIAFIMSFDMLETLGDLLGAPSLQSNRLLSKVI